MEPCLVIICEQIDRTRRSWLFDEFPKSVLPLLRPVNGIHCPHGRDEPRDEQSKTVVEINDIQKMVKPYM